MDAWLYILLLGIGIVIYAYLLPKPNSRNGETDMIKEIEEMFGDFSADLEEENKQLIQMIAKMKTEYELHLAKLTGRIESLEQQNSHLSIQLEQFSRNQLQNAAKEQAAIKADIESEAGSFTDTAHNSASDSFPPATNSPNLRERYKDLFNLYDQGKSTEQIAKKLGMNKGEVLLILQLAKQEEQSRV